MFYIYNAMGWYHIFLSEDDAYVENRNAHRARFSEQGHGPLGLARPMTRIRPVWRSLPIALSGIFAGISPPAHGEGWLPPIQKDIGWYEEIWKSSPFVAAAQIAPITESISSRYAVTGYAKVNGADIVFIFDRKNLERFWLSGKSAQSGVELISVTDAEDIKKLRAKIQAEGQVAEIFCDTNLNTNEIQTIGNIPRARESVVASGSPTPAQASPNSIRPVASVHDAPEPGNQLSQASVAPAPVPERIIRRRSIKVP